MASTRVQYMGFTTDEIARRYALRIWQPDGETHDLTMSIPNAAFVAERVRYQDGPELCYRKLERELLACGDALTASNMDVTDVELEAFRESQKPKSKQRR